MGAYYGVDASGKLRGFKIAGDLPTDDELTRINTKLGAQEQAVEQPSTLGPLGYGYQTGMQSVEQFGSRVAQSVGLDRLSAGMADAAQEREGILAGYKPKYASYTDVKGIGDVVPYVAEKVQESAFPAAAAIGGGILGALAAPEAAVAGGAAAAAGALDAAGIASVIGAAVPTFAQLAGSNLQRQMTEQGIPLSETNLGTAALTAIPQTAADIALYRVMGWIGPIFKTPAAKPVVDQVKRSLVTRFGTKVVEGMLTEAGTETFQQALEILQANPDKLFRLDEDVKEELLNSFIAGGAVGGVFGPLGPHGDHPAAKTKDKEVSDAVQRELQPRQLEMQRAQQDNLNAGIAASLHNDQAEAALAEIKNLNEAIREAEAARSSSTEAATKATLEEASQAPVPSQFRETGATITPLTSQETFGYEVRTPAGNYVKQFPDAATADREARRVSESIRPQTDPALQAQLARLPLTELPLEQANKIRQERYNKGYVSPHEIDAGVGFEEAGKILGKSAADFVTQKLGIQDQVNLLKAKEAAPAAAELAKPPGWRRLPHVSPVVSDITATPEPKTSPLEQRVDSKLEIREDTSGVTPVPGSESKTPHAVTQGAKTLILPTKKAAEAMAKRWAAKAPKIPVHVEPRRKAFSLYETAMRDGKPVSKLLGSFPTKQAAEQARRTEETKRSVPGVKRGLAGVSEAAATAKIKELEAKRDAAVQKGQRAAVASSEAERSMAERNDKFGAAKEALLEHAAKSGIKRTAIKLVYSLSNKTQLAEGGYGNKLIQLATDIYQPNMPLDDFVKRLTDVLNHEIVHALRDADAFSKSEWKALEKHVRQTKAVINGKPQSYTWFDRARAIYKDANEDTIAEEAVAEAYRHWYRTRGAPTPPHVKSLFRRMMELLKGLFQFASRTPAATSVFEGIAKGRYTDLKEKANAPRAVAASKFAMLFGPAHTFFSPIEAYIETSRTKKMPAAQWLKTLENKPEYKQELLDSGLGDWLRSEFPQDKHVSQREIIDWLQNNMINIDERILGEDEDPDNFDDVDEEISRAESDWVNGNYKWSEPWEVKTVETNQLDFWRGGETRVWELWQNYPNAKWLEDNENDPEAYEPQLARRYHSQEEAVAEQAKLNNEDREVYSEYIWEQARENVDTDEIMARHRAAREPKFKRYVLPGGSDYREILMTLPDGNNFSGHHWKNEIDDNVFAHALTKTRKLATSDGRKFKLLHGDEIQSDWHQQGRDTGHVGKVSESDRESIYKAYEEAEKKYYALYQKKLKEATGYDNGQDYLHHLREEVIARYMDDVSRIEGDPLTSAKAAEVANEVEQRKSDGLAGAKAKAKEIEDQINADPEVRALSAESNRLHHEYVKSKSGVPDAPFKDSWWQLVLKRLIKYAVDNDYQGIVVSPYQAIDDRYGQAITARAIEVRKFGDDVYTAKGWKPGSRMNYTPDKTFIGLSAKELTKLFHDKTVAAQLLAQVDANPEGEAFMTNEGGIHFGKQGNRFYYGERIPKFLDKYLGRLGVKTEEVELPATGDGGGPYKATAYIFNNAVDDFVGDGQPLYSGKMSAIPNYSALSIDPVMVEQVQNRLVYNAVADAVGNTLRYIGLPKRRADMIQYGTERALQLLQDKMLPVGILIDKIRKAGGNVVEAMDTYLKYELMRGRTGNAINANDVDFVDPAILAIGRLATRPDDINELTAVAPRLGRLAQGFENHRLGLFNAYLYARHARERNALIRVRDPDKFDAAGNKTYAGNKEGSGISDAEAEAALAWFDRHPGIDGIRQAEGKLRAIIDNTNKLRVQYNLTPDFDRLPTPEEFVAAGLPNGFQYYVPLRGYVDEDISLDPSDQRDIEGAETEAREHGSKVRIANADGSETIRTGTGVKVRGKEDRNTLGRTSLATNIVEHVILQNMQAIIRGEKNLVAQSLYRLVSAFPDKSIDHFGRPVSVAEFAEIIARTPLQRKLVNGVVKCLPNPEYKNRPDVLVAKVPKDDGTVEEVAIRIHDKRMQCALTGANGLGSNTAGAFVNAIGSVTRLMAKMSTQYNPVFFLTNWPRDLATAGININQYESEGLTKAVLGNVKDALRAIYVASPHRSLGYLVKGQEAEVRTHVGKDGTDWSALLQQFQSLGGDVSFWGLETVEDLTKKINAKLRQGDTPVTKGWAAFKRLGEFVEAHNKAIESSTRLAVFKALLDQNISPELAAQGAKNITVNFDKGGEWKPVMNALYMFYNASFQGTMGLFTAGARSAKVRKIMTGIVAAGIFQDMLMSMLSEEDDKGDKLYDQIPDYLLEHRLVFLDPTGSAPGGFASIPMPYGYNAFHNIGRSLSRYARGRYTIGEAINTGLGAGIEAFNPMGGTSSFLALAAPTILDPVVELAQNKDWANRKIYNEGNPFGANPPTSQLYWSNTNPAAIGIADFLHRLTGGTAYFPGGVEISPDVLQYLARYYAGGVGVFLGQIQSFATQTIPDALSGQLDELEIRDVPVANKLIGNVTSRATREEFFDVLDEVRRARKEFEAAVKGQDPESIKAAMEAHKGLLAIFGPVRALDNARSNLSQQIRKIEANGRLGQEQKLRLVKPIKERLKQIEFQAVKLYNERVRDTE